MERSGIAFTARAAAAVSLLAGVYVLAALLVVAAVGMDVAALAHPSAVTIKLVIASTALLAAVVRAFRGARVRDQAPFGVPLSRSDQPPLWSLVDTTAKATGTSAPDEIWLVPDANAGVSEQGSLWRRESRHRRLVVGLPLLAVLTVDELTAVLAHEMAHYSHRHTRLSPIVYRGTTTLARLVKETGGRPLTGHLVRGYAAVYFRVAASINRRQELEADSLAASVAGGAAMVGALERMPWLVASWEYFSDRFVGAGLEAGTGAGCLPAEFLAHYSTLACDKQRLDEFEAARLHAPAPRTQVYDSHPPTTTRVAALARLATAPSLEEDGRPATALLLDPDGVSRQFEALLSRASGCPVRPWQEFGATVGDSRARLRAGALIAGVEHLEPETTADLGAALDLAHSDPVGLGIVLLGTDAPSNQTKRDRVARETTSSALVALMSCALVEGGHAVWVASLTGAPFQLVRRDGAPLDVAFLVRQALEDAAGLETMKQRLQALGVSLDYRVEPDPRLRGEVGQRWLASLTRVAHRLGRVDVVVRTDGILVVPSRGRFSGGGKQQRLDELRDVDPVQASRANRKTRWIPSDQIISARLRGNGIGALLHKQWSLQLHTQTGKRLRLVLESANQATVARSGLARLLGERLQA